MLCTACTLLFASEASAQCTARDVLQNQLRLQLGFGLAAAEVGPQLRRQYFDQPIGEFLIIGMEPIRTWTGAPVILNVANGGAGLIVIGQDGSADARISVSSRFAFVRTNEAAPAEEQETVALIDR